MRAVCNSAAWTVWGLATILALVAPWGRTGVGWSQDPVPAANPSPVSYAREIRPIFQARCFGCHQSAKREGQYLMTDFSGLLAGGASGEPAIVPGNPADSYLLELVTPVDGKVSMPPQGPALTDSERDLIRRWIAEGADNDLPAQRLIYDRDHPPRYSRPPIITTLDFSPDGQWLAVSGIHEVVLLRMPDGVVAGRLIGRSPRIESLAFSPDSQFLAVTGGQPGEFGELQVWDIPQQALRLSQAITGDTLFGVSWSPDGKQIALGGTDNTLRSFNATTGEQVLFQNVSEDWIRDTVFTLDGSHLISVGRDMTCKLTEVATERFVDNITSITPGMLKGGISSVARHPARDEIIVGSADGLPKLYRVFRETKRVIGDDANLLREFPQMPGRVQAVAISPDGRRAGFVSGIDGQSEFRVYSLDFDTRVPDEIKAINGKVVTSRTPEEHQRLKEFHSRDLQLLGQGTLANGAWYALTFAANGTGVWVAGSAGEVREYDSQNGQLLRTLQPFPVDSASAEKATNLTWPRLPEISRDVPSLSSSSETPDYQTLVITPARLTFRNPRDYVQLVVEAVAADGSRRDVTDRCDFSGCDPQLLSVNSNALVEPCGDGSGALRVKYAGLSAEVPVDVQLHPLAVDFVRDVNPLLGKLGCNAGTCHGSQNGKRGFKLSLRGYDPLFDVRGLTDDLSSRRVNVAAPDSSLILLKATAQVPHEGGKLMTVGDRNYVTLREWIAAGAPLDLATPKITALRVEPPTPVLADQGHAQQLRVIATDSQGNERDVSREAFLESADQEVAVSNAAGQVLAKRRGETALLARYEGAFAAARVTVMGPRPGFVWSEPPIHNEIDRMVARKWEQLKIVPSELCTDAEFLRRLSLDLTGLPPTIEEVRTFLNDPTPSREKRTAAIQRLLESPEYVDHWTNKWADLLQVNEKYLARDGAIQLHAWIRQQVAERTPYDDMVRSILTARGSNAEHPAAAYFKIHRTPEELLENTTHLFLAIRFNCNKCHDHPFERWTQDQYYQTAAFFAQVERGADPASAGRTIGGSAVESATPLFEVIQDATQGEVTHERTKAIVPPVFPFPSGPTSSPELPRREQFANWLTAPDNPYFASSFVNRIWGYLMGVGLIEPLDDIRASNPPTNPELLAYLTREFVDHDFDVRHLIRLICESRTYQLSMETNSWNADDRFNYSHALPRRLPAEVLFDSLYRVTGSQTRFPGEPLGRRAAQLPDAGAQLPSGLLATLGKPVRESACECERANDLHLGSVLALVSGPDQVAAIHDPANALSQLVSATPDNRQLIAELYLRILNRPASEKEITVALEAFETLQSDHESLVAQRVQRAAEVEPGYQQLEAERIRRLEEAQVDLATYLAKTDPELPHREQARSTRLAELDQQIQAFEQSLDEQVAAFRRDHLSSIQWHPLLPMEMTNTSGAGLKPGSGASIRQVETKGPTTTTIIVTPDLARISALRLEALAAEDLPGKGPGLAPNGNFVISELRLEMAPPEEPETWRPVKLAAAWADHAQPSFPASGLIDHDLQGGWAVVPQTGTTHWATLELETPLAPTPGTRLRVTLVQQFDALHQLGQFRLSVTPSLKPVGVSLSSELLEAVQLPPESWTEPVRARIRELVRTGSPMILALRRERSAIEPAIPVEPGIQERRMRVQHLSQVTPRDAELLRLEQDERQSQMQLETLRLTATQDLAWALINSPAFLFNH